MTRPSARFFIENSRSGRTLFELTETHLISTRWTLGVREEESVELRTLDPVHDVHPVRLTGMLAFFGALAVAGALMLRFSVLAPEGLRAVLTVYPLLLLGGALVGAIRYTPKLDLVVFRDSWGHPKIHIGREAAQFAECEHFVAEIAHRILLAQGEASNRESGPVDVAANEHAPRLSFKVKASIVSGSVAAVLPVVPGANDLLFDFLLPLVLGSSTVALVLSVLSIWEREGGRWWSLIGAVAALIPPIFYS